MEIEQSTIERQSELLLNRKNEGISDRGFFASGPVATSELSAAVAKHGIIPWYLRIYVADSVQSAKAHAALEPDPLMQGIYLINSNSSEHAKVVTEEAAPEVFRRLTTENPIYFFNVKRNLEFEIVDPDLVKKILSIDELFWNFSDLDRGPCILQAGWAWPRYRGVVLYEATVASKTYASIRKLARRLNRQGWKVSFNRDFERSLNMARDQKRKSGGTWVASSVYKTPSIYQAALDGHASGRAFSVEVWNEQGELAAGSINFKDGPIFSTDTVFYDVERYPKDGIQLVKVSDLAFMDRLGRAGVPFLDVGMVTSYSATMKAELIPMENYLQLVANLPNVDVDISSDWEP